MKTFNPIFLPHTPKNEFNYIGAAERYFEKINGGFAPETKDAYIDYYNNDRVKLRLKGMSPVQYRTHFAEAI